MLPIQIQIVGQNKSKFFIPFVYLIVTCSACYLFLLGQVQNSPKFDNLIEDYTTTSTGTNFTRDLGLNVVQNSSSSSSTNRNLQRNSSKFGKVSKNRIEIDDLYFPWPSDENCSKFYVKFAKKGTFKPRALVSFPGSGNTWLRYLIECSTGIFTGSVFKDSSLYKAGLLGEFRKPNDGSTIIQKTHHDTAGRSNVRMQKSYIKLSELMFGYRGILLIRNPYQAIVSYWNYYNTKSHKGHLFLAKSSKSEQQLNQNQTFDENYKPFEDSYYDFESFVQERISNWTGLIKSWLSNSDDVILVFYDDLKRNPPFELNRILNYLQISVDQDRLDCLLKGHLEGPFLRKIENKKDSVYTEQIFSKYPALYEEIQDNIDEVNEIFAKWELPIKLNYTIKN